MTKAALQFLLALPVALAQAPTTYLETPVDLTGDTVTLRVRVNAPNGASGISSLLIYLFPPTSSSLNWHFVNVNVAAKTIDVRVPPQNPPTPLRFMPGAGTLGVPFGAPIFHLLSYRFVDPASSGNLLQVDLTLRRMVPSTGTLTFYLYARDAIGNMDSEPGLYVPAGTWNYTPVSSPNIVLTPSGINALASGYRTRVSLNGALSTPPTVTTASPWIHISDVQEGGFNLVIDPNTGPVPLSGSISVSGGGNSATLPVTQSALVQQPPVVSLLAPISQNGETVTIKARVFAPNGAAGLSNLDIQIGSAGYFQIAIDLQARKIWIWDVFSNPNNWNNTSLVQFPSGTFTHPNFGFAPLQLTGYTFREPNVGSLDVLEVDLILKRAVPFTGKRFISVQTTDPLTQLSSIPGQVSLGDWTYDGPTADFTLSQAFNWLGGLDPISFQMTITPQLLPPGNITLLASEPNVTFSPSVVNLTTMTAQTVTVNLPFRTASYPLVITARAGTSPAKTQTVNVNITKWDYELVMSPDQTVISGGMARFTVSVNPLNGFFGSVVLNNLSGFGNLSHASLMPGQVAIFTAAGSEIAAVNNYEVRIEGSNQDGVRQVLRRIAVRPVPYINCTFFNTHPPIPYSLPKPLKLKKAELFDATCISTGYTGDLGVFAQASPLDLAWSPQAISIREGESRAIQFAVTLQFWGTSASQTLLTLGVQGPAGVQAFGSYQVSQQSDPIPKFEVAPPSPLLLVPAGSQLLVPVRITRAETSPGVPFAGSVAFCGAPVLGGTACASPAVAPIAPYTVLAGPSQSAGSILVKTTAADKGLKTFAVNWAEMNSAQPLSGTLLYTVWVQDAPAQPSLSVAGNPSSASGPQGRTADYTLKVDYQNLRGPVRFQLGNGWPAGTYVAWPDASGISLPADKVTQTITISVGIPANAPIGSYIGDLKSFSEGVSATTTLSLNVTDGAQGAPKFTVTAPGYQFLSAAGQPWPTRVPLTGKVKLRLIDPNANSGYPLCQVEPLDDRGTTMQCSRPLLYYGQDAESEVTIARVPVELINQVLDFRLTYSFGGESIATKVRVEFRLESTLPKNREDYSALEGMPITEFIRMGGRVVVIEKK